MLLLLPTLVCLRAASACCRQLLLVLSPVGGWYTWALSPKLASACCLQSCGVPFVATLGVGVAVVAGLGSTPCLSCSACGGGGGHPVTGLKSAIV